MSNSDAADVPLDRPLSKTARALASTLLTQPGHHAQQARALACGLARALGDQSAPASLTQDARFSHPGWQGPVRRRLLKVWKLCGEQSRTWAAGLQLPGTDLARLHSLLHQLEEASAPSNTPFCPRFLERLQQSGGRSLAQGARLLVQDMALQRAIPAQTPDLALLVGRDMACTPGAVVRREPLYELLQYQPTTPQVRARPLLIIPPPLNRFYLLDMTSQSSLVRHALDQGLQVFMLSWRNPNPSQCEWGLESYTQAAREALGTVRQISASDQATLLGVCAGGLIGLLLQGCLQADGCADQIAAASYFVTPLASEVLSEPLLFASPEVRRALRNRIWQQGCLGPRQLAAGFAWLLPRQLIWSPLLRRYTLGEEGNAHPVRVWNQDSTRLPAQLVDDLLRLFEGDWFAGPFSFAGRTLDLARITSPSWHLGAASDHIVPWLNSYPGIRLGGERTFVLSSGGHIQSLLNHPGLPRTWYSPGLVEGADPGDWTASQGRQSGSWWPHWTEWLQRHSGDLSAAPVAPGSTQYPALDAAPGRYVHQA